jgi:hypothetical protein
MRHPSRANSPPCRQIDHIGDSPDALKPAELELLSGPRWRLMVMPSALNQLKRMAQQFPECRCVMADDRQAATTLGAVRRKRSNDYVTTRAHGS